LKKFLVLLLITSTSLYGFGRRIELCFSDPEKIRKKSSSPEDRLIVMINSCTKSFKGAFYDISSVKVAEALVKARNRGIAVRLVTDSDTLSGKAIEKILKGGIPVVEDNRPSLMHNKFAVIDGYFVYTGSTNATLNGSYKNNNNSLIISSPELAEIYDSEFEEMFSHGIFGNRRETGAFTALTKKYHVRIDDADINVYFSPEDNVERIINSRLKKAKKSIRFLAFSFTSDSLGETMIEKFKKGLTVEGVFERRGANSEYSEYTKMMIEGLPVFKDRNRHIMHHKVIIIDDYRVITGSFNFSKNADRNNDENILIIDSEEIAAEYTEEFRRIFRRAKR